MIAHPYPLETAFAKSRVATVETIAHLKAETINSVAPTMLPSGPASNADSTLIPVQFSESAFVPAIHFVKQAD